MRVPTREAAARVGRHPKTIRGWAEAGLIRAYRVGPRNLQVELDDVLAQVVPYEVIHDDPKAAATRGTP